MSDQGAAARHHQVHVWRDDFGEWIWSCSCTPDLHGGYASAGSATREGAVHRMEATRELAAGRPVAHTEKGERR